MAEKNANCSFSEITVFNHSMTPDFFINKVEGGGPPGFSNFRKFLPGDYEYRKAKIKAVLSTVSDDTPSFSNLKVIVDVPDIHNKGTAIISNASTGADVVFYRPYSVNPPDVIMSFKGGVGGVATPEITNESLTGFTVKLINSSGTYITGSVTWAADGY